MKPNSRGRRNASRQAATELLRGIATGTADVYESYRQLYGIWCRNNSAVQELRPLFRIPGIEPDGRLSVTADFQWQVRHLAASLLDTLQH